VTLVSVLALLSDSAEFDWDRRVILATWVLGRTCTATVALGPIVCRMNRSA
jgi:hypothetical protein